MNNPNIIIPGQGPGPGVIFGQKIHLNFFPWKVPIGSNSKNKIVRKINMLYLCENYFYYVHCQGVKMYSKILLIL